MGVFLHNPTDQMANTCGKETKWIASVKRKTMLLHRGGRWRKSSTIRAPLIPPPPPALPSCFSSSAATSIWALVPKRDQLRRAGLSSLFSRIRGPPPPGRQLHRHRRFLDVNSAAAGNDRTLHPPLLIFSLSILPIPVRCVLVPNGISIDRYNLLDRNDTKKKLEMR